MVVAGLLGRIWVPGLKFGPLPSAPTPVKWSGVVTVEPAWLACKVRAKKPPKKLGTLLTGSHQVGAHGSQLVDAGAQNAFAGRIGAAMAISWGFTAPCWEF